MGLEDLFKYLDGEMELEELLRAEPSTPRPPSAGPYPNRATAVYILREARFAPAVIEELERELPERDRTVYAWIKRAEAIASEIPPPPPSTPSAPTKTSAPPTPPKSTRRSHR